jgi:hypothetical protein
MQRSPKKEKKIQQNVPRISAQIDQKKMQKIAQNIS